MTKPNHETYRQYLGALALVLGAFATFNPAEALAADPLEFDASAKQQLQAMAVDVTKGDADMSCASSGTVASHWSFRRTCTSRPSSISVRSSVTRS